MTTLTATKLVSISYVFRAIKDQSKLDKLIAESQAKGYTHVAYETVEGEEADNNETVYRRKEESYQVTIPDFAAVIDDPSLAKFLEQVTIDALKAEGMAYVNQGFPVVFDFEKVVADILAGKSKAAAAGASISAESLKTFVELFTTFLENKSAKKQGIDLMTTVIKAKFSASKVAPLGVEGVSRIAAVLDTFKAEVLELDQDIAAALLPVYDHLKAKAEEAMKPKEVDYNDLLSF